MFLSVRAGEDELMLFSSQNCNTIISNAQLTFRHARFIMHLHCFSWNNGHCFNASVQLVW